jgi:hypothetical protein
MCIGLNKVIKVVVLIVLSLDSEANPKILFISRKKSREIIFWQSGFFYRKKAVKAPAE